MNPLYKIFLSVGKGALGGLAFVASITIDETSQTTIGSAVAVGVLLVYVVRWMQKVNDKLENLQKQLDKIEAQRAIDHRENQERLKGK